MRPTEVRLAVSGYVGLETASALRRSRAASVMDVDPGLDPVERELAVSSRSTIPGEHHLRACRKDRVGRVEHRPVGVLDAARRRRREQHCSRRCVECKHLNGRDAHKSLTQAARSSTVGTYSRLEPTVERLASTRSRAMSGIR